MTNDRNSDKSHDLDDPVPEFIIDAAISELRKLGALVHPIDPDDDDVGAFHIACLVDDVSFFDRSGRYIVETRHDDGYLNPHGYRQDVHDVLAKYKLVSALDSPSFVVVYRYYDAGGLDHWQVKRCVKWDAHWLTAHEQGLRDAVGSDEYWSQKRKWMAAGLPLKIAPYITDVK